MTFGVEYSQQAVDDSTPTISQLNVIFKTIRALTEDLQSSKSICYKSLTSLKDWFTFSHVIFIYSLNKKDTDSYNTSNKKMALF